jgi:hypothetical protein
MSEISTDDKNEVIAIFMGYKVYHKRYPRNHGIGAPEMEPEKCMIIQKAKYHSDWSWLMPVWFKVQNIGADLGYSFKKYHEKFHAGIDHQKIEICHEIVYQFIQWYNKTKEK